MATVNSAYNQRVDTIFQKARTKRYPKNQLIHYQGDSLTQVYLIKEGYIKVYTILDSGDTRTFLILGPGDIFPLAFSITLDWERYQLKYFYQTLTDVQLQVLPSAVFKKVIDTNLAAMNTYLSYLSASNEIIMEQLEVMKEKKAITKVELLLPYLVSKLGKEIKPNIYQLKIKLSHQEIADLSGVTRETTTTLLQELEKKGVLKQTKGTWIIHLPDDAADSLRG
jgi:CRP/FNR family cyclic AMP-dependent transcriptional regulator